MTKLTDNQLALMASILGVSNSGSDHLFEGHCPEWTPSACLRAFSGARRRMSVNSVTTTLVSGLCENEEMLTMFLEEAESLGRQAATHVR